MGAWSGWQSQLMKAAGFPDSAGNDTFVTDWHASADSNCRNNPVDISYKSRGATNCKRLTGQHTAQNYASHGAGASAFNSQIHDGNYPALLAALHSGTPYNVPNPKAVIGDLIVWGSEKFAFELQNNYGPPHGGGSGGGGGKGLHEGWHDMRRSFNQRFPAALHKSQRNTDKALRILSKARKVRL